MLDPPFIFILGASTRAAAMSAVRAGYRPVCGDLFGDEDLRAIADVLPVADYPRGLVETARRAPPGPWMYTGALENHPAVIDAITVERPLYGCPAAAVCRVRDPARVFELLSGAGLPVLGIRSADDPPPADGTWMLKPLRGAAGRGIHIWNAATAADRATPSSPGPHYFQQRADGRPYSGLYLAGAAGTQRIGFARQLIGERALHAAGYQYCGSIGPLTLPETTAHTLDAVAAHLAADGGLRGLFGLDFLFDGQTPWLTEINPRYTASVEVYEAAYDLSLLRAHIAVFQPQAPARSLTIPECPRHIVAKAILFAADDCTPPLLTNACLPGADAETTLHLADIPTPGIPIAQGHPVCTLLATAPTAETCLQSLNTGLQSLSVTLFSQPPRHLLRKH